MDDLFGVTEKMVKAGNDIASNLSNVSVRKSRIGLGGCKDFVLESYPKEFQYLIEAYIVGKIDSITAIYLAMEDVKAEETSNMRDAEVEETDSQITIINNGPGTVVVNDALILHKGSSGGFYVDIGKEIRISKQESAENPMTDYDQWRQDRQLMEHYKDALQKINSGVISPIQTAIDALSDNQPEVETTCPFCKGKDTVIQEFGVNEFENDATVYAISCIECRSRTSWFSDYNKALYQWKEASFRSKGQM